MHYTAAPVSNIGSCSISTGITINPWSPDWFEHQHTGTNRCNHFQMVKVEANESYGGKIRKL